MSAVLPPSPAPEESPAARPLPGSPTDRLLLVITLLLVFLMAARTPLDSDMWWHLSAGEALLRSGQILRADMFSFTRAGAPWVNIFWLADLGLAALFRAGGYFALSLAVAALAVISLALVWAQSEGPVFLKAAAALLAGVVSSVVWSPRPQMASLALTAAVGYVLFLYRRRGVDRLWALPLLFALWANLHGGYPLGFLLIGGVLAGEALNHLLAHPSGAMPWTRIARLAGWGALCALAVLANPFGLDAWRLPFQTVNMQVLQQYIPEWASPDFHDPLQQVMLALLFAVFAAAALSGRMMDGADLIVLLLFGGLALLARRNFGPFALVAAPLLVRYVAGALREWQARAPWAARRWRSTPPGGAEQPAVKKAVNLLLAALIGLAAVGKLAVVSHPALVGHYAAQGYPTAAATWMEGNLSPGNVLNEYEWGGWMHWRLPAFPVFVDGRTDLFGDAVVRDWITLVQAGPGWAETLARYPVQYVMLRPERPLVKALPEAGWRELYRDAQVVVYGRK